MIDSNQFEYADELEAMIERIEHNNLHEEIKQENFALGLPTSYMKGEDNIREYPDGTLEYFTYVDGKYTVLKTEQKNSQTHLKKVLSGKGKNVVKTMAELEAMENE